jgi:6,7-dimethyl-8-ribityllumazine synthase
MMKKFALIVSEFNSHITDKLLDGTLSRLIEKGIDEKNINVHKVPGAIEIPLIAQLLARSNKYSALICLGAVIRGDTDHYDYVCDQVSRGCQQVMLAFEIPVIFGILTTNNEEQALERVGGTEGHTGIYAADAALRMNDLISELL